MKKRGSKFKIRGFLKKDLSKKQYNLLNNDWIAPFLKNRQAANIILSIQKTEMRYTTREKLFLNPNNQEIVKIEDIEESYNLINWNCAICNTEIKSHTINYSAENFCCIECANVHKGTKTIDQRIVDSSVNFTKYCKIELRKEQKEFLKYIRSEKDKDYPVKFRKTKTNIKNDTN